GNTLTMTVGGPDAFVQVALHQTPAGGGPLSASDGLAAYLLQGVYDASVPGWNPGVFNIPATVPGGTGTLPSANLADMTYSLVRTYRTGSGGSMNGGNESTATAFRFGGLNLNPPPSPSVDANGLMFLGTFQIHPVAGGNSAISLRDPNPGVTTIDNITDMGVNLDTIIFGVGGSTQYVLGVNVAAVPEPSSFILGGLIFSGAIGARLRRRKANAI